MATRLAGTDLYVSETLAVVLTHAAESQRLAALLCDSYVARSIVVATEANYLDGEESGMLSYITPKRIDAAYDRGDGLMSSSLRQSASVGKVLRKVVVSSAFAEGPEIAGRNGMPHRLAPITDAEVEQLTLVIQANYTPIAPFIVTGEAIRYWYAEPNYTTTEVTTLHNSCMRYSSNWNETRFFAQNPRVCGMLCLLGTDGKVAARALLWNGKDDVFMDRVYGSDRNQKAFRRFADKRGWRYRVSDSTDATKPNAGGFVGFPLQRCNEAQKPAYLDTFDLFLYHATGDLAARKTKSGSLVTRGDLDGDYEGDRARNPVVYAAIGLKYETVPTGHPLSHTDRYRYPDPYADRLTARDDKAIRDARVDWLSDLSAVPPWPADLLRTDPTWTLEQRGSDPEDDAANLAVVPPRRTEALVIERPTPKKADWSGVLVDGIGVDAFRQNVAALEAAFNHRVARGRAIVDGAMNPVAVHPIDNIVAGRFAAEAVFNPDPIPPPMPRAARQG